MNLISNSYRAVGVRLSGQAKSDWREANPRNARTARLLSGVRWRGVNEVTSSSVSPVASMDRFPENMLQIGVYL